MPALAYYAHKIRKKERKKVVYPLRDPLVSSVLKMDKRTIKNNLDQHEKRYRFHDINLTSLEIKYLKCLSALMSQKEIAYQNQCSETAVRKVILNVKNKFGNGSMPNSKLFQLLKEKGVTLTYLNQFLS